MTKKFPTIGLALHSSKQMFSFPLGMGISIGLFVAMMVFFFGLFFILFADFDFAAMEAILNGELASLPAPREPGDGGGVFVALVPLLAIISFIVGYAWIFNMWVRFGAFGREGAFFKKPMQGIGAAAITALKMLFISLFLGIVALVALLALAAFGLVSFDPSSIAEPTLANAVMVNLVSMAVISGTYSLFSSNLTQTALGSDTEEVGPPHVFEFGIVLFILNAALLLPLAILQFYVPLVVVAIIQFIGSLWLMAAIPLAHGIRYDWQRQVFAGESAAEQFGLESDQAAPESDDENP